MENINKGLTVPKCMLIVRPKIPQMPQNLYVQFVCLSLKVLDFNEKRLPYRGIQMLFIWKLHNRHCFNIYKQSRFCNCIYFLHHKCEKKTHLLFTTHLFTRIENTFAILGQITWHCHEILLKAIYFTTHTFRYLFNIYFFDKCVLEIDLVKGFRNFCLKRWP